MRYLTRAWASGELADVECEAAEMAYRARRTTVLPTLPAKLRAFAESVSVHDALPYAVELDPSGGTLRIGLRAGDLQRGYADVALEYGGVRVELLDVAVLRLIADDPAAEALYDEIDREDSDGPGEPALYVHRWLWWPFRRELDVHFSRFDFQVTPRETRDVDPSRVRFVEVGAPAV